MKRNNLIIGSVGIVATAALFAVSPWKPTDSEGAYTKESFSSLTEKSVDDAKLWMERRYLDPETGERISEKKMRQIKSAIGQMEKSRAVAFVEQGPDNIGGRTRAIQIDVTNNNIIWAGGVSGGLFKSLNGANTWDRVDGYEASQCSPFISSMCQFTNGTLFVATGSNHDDWGGNGVWYTQDQGASWTQVPGTASFSSGRITEVVAPENGTTIWMTTQNGLKKWNFGDATLTDVTTGAGACNALACSPNGQIIVCAIGSNKTYVSSDFGNTFVDKSGLGSDVVPNGSGRYQYAVSHEPDAAGNYSIYVARTQSNLSGMNVSHDNGNTWSQFVGASGAPSNLNIYNNQGTYNSAITVDPQNNKKILVGGLDIWKWEQTTNNPPAGGFEKLSEWFSQPTAPKYVHADNHEFKWDGSKLFIGNDGGVGISYNPEISFFPANRGYNVTQFYGIAFDRNGAVLGGTQDNGSLYNDHQLSTFLEFTEVSGGDGFQCEISFFNPNIMFTTVQFGDGLRSSDAGQTMEPFVPNPLPASYDPFGTSGSPNHPFHSKIFLAEYYDTNSEDSVVYIPDSNYATGETIMVPSLATGDTISYTLTSPLYFSDTLNYETSLTVMETSIVDSASQANIFLDLYSWVHVGTSGSGLVPPIVGDSLEITYDNGQIDTVVVFSTGSYAHYYGQHPISGNIYDMGTDSVIYDVAWNTVTVQDPYQSWYLMYVNANGGELWGTRNALRLSAPEQQWGIIVQGIGGGGFNNVDAEFSRDLNHLYISTGGGTVTRVDGLGSLYTSSPTFNEDAFYHLVAGTSTAPNATSTATLTPGGAVEGICVNPADADDVLFLHGFASTRMRRSLNATSASPTYSAVGSMTGASSTDPGAYDAIIDRENDQILVVGTSDGVFVTEDGGTTWENGSAGFMGTPVYEVRQSWRTWDEGNFRPGEIYIGTFGRGIWSTSSYLSTNDNDQADNGTSIDEFDTNLYPYPNPTTASTSLSFELANTSDVTIQVYNLSGRLVKSISKKNMSQGSQIVDIEGADLSTGTYVVKMFAGKQQATTKFVKM